MTVTVAVTSKQAFSVQGYKQQKNSDRNAQKQYLAEYSNTTISKQKTDRKQQLTLPNTLVAKYKH